MRLAGLHHTSHLTADAEVSDDFYTRVLGLRRVWKTVNFDDPSMFHLAYGDRAMTAGTLLTFFEYPLAAPARPGRRTITETALRIPSERALAYWQKRLGGTRSDRDGKPALEVRDPEGLPLALVVDAGGDAVPWPDSPVPEWAQLRGLYGVTLTVAERAPTADVLEGVLGLPPDGPLRVVEAPDAPVARLGRGGTHHVAVWTPRLDDLRDADERVRASALRSTGIIDRTFSHHLYFREPGGVLLEILADVPGRRPYATDEEIGARVALPDHLESQRERIEARIRVLDRRLGI